MGWGSNYREDKENINQRVKQMTDTLYIATSKEKYNSKWYNNYTCLHLLNPIYPTARRTCLSPACRNKWAMKEAFILFLAHQDYEKFDYWCRFTPPKEFNMTERAKTIRAWLKQVTKWCKRKNKSFDARMYPHKTFTSMLHWEGVIRCSPDVLYHARALLRKRWGKLQGRCAIKPLGDDAMRRIYYVCGVGNKQLRTEVIEDACIIKCGNAFVVGKRKLLKVRSDFYKCSMVNGAHRAIK